MQMSLLDLMRQPAILRPVDPCGAVVPRGLIDEVLELPHPRLAWELARIELHRAPDGLWMWATGLCGGGYRVGEKWGHYAASRDDAAHHGAVEILASVERVRDAAAHGITAAQLRQIATWARNIAEAPESVHGRADQP